MDYGTSKLKNKILLGIPVGSDILDFNRVILAEIIHWSSRYFKVRLDNISKPISICRSTFRGGGYKFFTVKRYNNYLIKLSKLEGALMVLDNIEYLKLNYDAILEDRPKSIHVDFGDKSEWLPKSQVEYDEKYVWVPEWLAIKKELDSYCA